jgi:hypothetical protein
MIKKIRLKEINEPKLVTNVELPLIKSLEAPDVLKAVKSITKQYDPTTKYKAWLATKGIIGEDQPQITNETVE